jgi:hypothetical protein
MDEFTGIAIWVLAIFLAVNVTIVWFDSSVDMQNAGLGLGIVPDTQYGLTDMNSTYTTIFGVSCNNITSNDVVNGTLCGVGQIWDSMIKLTQTLWGGATAWTNLLAIVLNPFGSLGVLLKSILIPFFTLIEFLAIFIILLRVVGVIRGGS